MSIGLGAAGQALGVSGGDLRRAGIRRISEEQLVVWQTSPPPWLARCQARKQRNAERQRHDAARQAQKVEITCSLCGKVQLRKPATAESAATYILVCDTCDRRGLKPEIVVKRDVSWTREIGLAGGFVGWKPYEPPKPGSRNARDAFMFRAYKEGVNDAEARRRWNEYRIELARRSDDSPLANIVVLRDRLLDS